MTPDINIRRDMMQTIAWRMTALGYIYSPGQVSQIFTEMTRLRANNTETILLPNFAVYDKHDKTGRMTGFAKVMKRDDLLPDIETAIEFWDRNSNGIFELTKNQTAQSFLDETKGLKLRIVGLKLKSDINSLTAHLFS